MYHYCHADTCSMVVGGCVGWRDPRPPPLRVWVCGDVARGGQRHQLEPLRVLLLPLRQKKREAALPPHTRVPRGIRFGLLTPLSHDDVAGARCRNRVLGIVVVCGACRVVAIECCLL